MMPDTSEMEIPAASAVVEPNAHVEDVNAAHGRAIQQQEHNRSYFETLTKDPKLLFWIGLMLWMLIVRGFENQASGTLLSVPRFKKDFGVLNQDGQYFISTQWVSAINGGPQAGGIIGAIAGSYFCDLFGFKIVLLIAAIINVSSIAIEFSATSITVFFGGKFLNYVAIGAFVNLCTAYVSDVSPLAIRASVIGFCNLSQCIGPFIAAIMANYTSSWTTNWAWKSLVCAQWGFAVVGLVGQIFLPESPVYLVRAGKEEAARKTLRRLYSRESDADGHLERIKLTLEESEMFKKSGTYAECFKGTNFRRTMIAIFVFLAQPMSGLAFVSQYGPLMYEYLGVSDQESFRLQIGGQVLSLTGATTSFLVADFFGRRPMFISGCFALSVLLLCMGIAGVVPSTPAATTAAVGFYTMFNFFYNAGVGSVVYTLAGEVPTSTLRTKTLAITLSLEAAVNTMWSFVSPYMFNPGYGDLKAKVGFVYGGFMVIFGVLAYFFAPETRHRTYEELDELFMQRVPARKFRTFQTVAETRALEAFNAQEKLGLTENDLS